MNKPTTKPTFSQLTGAGYSLPRLVTGQESGLKLFFSNIRSFLTERPVKVKNLGGHTAFTDPGFGDDIFENFKEWFRPLPRSARQLANSDMLVDWKPRASSFWGNLRDVIAPRKLPPLKVTSKPVVVPEIWSKNQQFRRVQAMSLAVHFLFAILIAVPLLPRLWAPTVTQASGPNVTPIDLSPYLAKLPPAAKKAGGGGGGGAHELLPASKGKLPKFSWTQIAKPAVKPPENSKLAMTPTVLGPPELKLPSPNMPNWGDPQSRVINDSSGPGSGAGIGSGSGGGVGSGSGGGVGPGFGWGAGGGFPSAGTGGYGQPECVYCPSPAYSDEAVKAKYQGVVLLRVVINPEGKAISAQIVKGLGLGLDEKALEAVRGWRFRPAYGPDRKAAAVSTLVEVTFRLL